MMNRKVSIKRVKMLTKPMSGLLLVGLIMFMVLSSCKTQNIEKQAFDMTGKKFAVMPFIKGKNPETIEQPLSCPFAQFCYPDNSIKVGSDESLTLILQELLRKEFESNVIPLAKVKDVYDALIVGSMEDTPRSLAKGLGKALAVDYIITGNVWRYRDRIGVSFSAEQPASVAFALYLVEVNTGITVWRGSYDKTQQSLTENILGVTDFIKQGAKWLTAEELARYGMKKILKQSLLK